MTERQPEAPADEMAAFKRSARILASIVARNHRVMEAARIEMLQSGPDAGMQWILNSLPDVWDVPETEWDGIETAQAWFDRAEAWYCAAEAASAAPGESAPDPGATKALSGALGQRQEHTGASEPESSLGEILHRARQAGGAGRPRPWPVEDWADRHPDLRALDEAMAEAVAAAVRERDGARLAAIREVLTTSLTDTGDELGVLERPADDSAMLDRTLRLIGRFLAILGSEEGLREH